MITRLLAPLHVRLTLWLLFNVSVLVASSYTALTVLNSVNDTEAPAATPTTLGLVALINITALLLTWCLGLYPTLQRLNQARTSAEQLAYRPSMSAQIPSHKDDIARITAAVEHIAHASVEETRQRRRDQQSLSHQATHDELTGLSNRKHGNETIARLDKTDSELPASILFLDLDGFKAVNDSYGHAIGDEILVAVSLRLKAILSDDCVLIRWGGDEFVIVLPEADQRAAITIARDVRDLFNSPIATSDGVHKLGCSIGMATSRPGMSMEVVLQEADARMYDDKKARKAEKIDAPAADHFPASDLGRAA